MSAALDFWFDFASTYSYPAAVRMAALAAHADVRVRFRPFLLGPIFKAQGWTTSPFNLYPEKGRYMWRDLERLCADLDVPFQRPDPFPQNSLLAARVALAGLDQSWGEAFCVAAFRAQFGGAAYDQVGFSSDTLYGGWVGAFREISCLYRTFDYQPLCAHQGQELRGGRRGQRNRFPYLHVAGAGVA